MDPVTAYHKQQRFLEIFGSADWDVYRKQERKHLYDKVGSAIFGFPYSEYGEEQRNHIQKVTDIIIQEDVHDDGGKGDTWMSIIILLVEPPEGDYYCHPVFRVPKYTCRVYNRHGFVDCMGRVYKNWKDFLENNKLPRSEMCYPVNGMYSQGICGHILIDFSRNKSNALFDILDTVSRVVALGSLGVAVAALVLPVPAHLVRPAIVGSTLCGFYGATRAIQDQLDRKRHGQSLCDEKSCWNWVSIMAAVYSCDLFQLNSLLLSSSLQIACWAGICLERAMTAHMFSNVNAGLVLLQDVPLYALLFSHTVIDSDYDVDITSLNEIEDLKSKTYETIGSIKVRYLEYVGFQNPISTEIFSEPGIYRDNCTFCLSFSCDIQMFGKILDYIQECINSTLIGEWINYILIDIKKAIEFFSKHDLAWAIKVTNKIVSEIICPKVEKAFYGTMAAFYSFIVNVLQVASSKANTLFDQYMSEIIDIVEIVKICMDKQDDFYSKFGKLCQDYILPRMGTFYICRSTHKVQGLTDAPPAEKIINPALSDPEIFYAASQAVGSPLNNSCSCK